MMLVQLFRPDGSTFIDILQLDAINNIPELITVVIFYNSGDVNENFLILDLRIDSLRGPKSFSGSHFCSLPSGAFFQFEIFGAVRAEQCTLGGVLGWRNVMAFHNPETTYTE